MSAAVTVIVPSLAFVVVSLLMPWLAKVVEGDMSRVIVSPIVWSTGIAMASLLRLSGLLSEIDDGLTADGLRVMPAILICPTPFASLAVPATKSKPGALRDIGDDADPRLSVMPSVSRSNLDAS